LTLFKHKFYDKYTIEFLKKRIGSTIKFGAFTVCESKIPTEHLIKLKYDDAEKEKDKVLVMFEISMYK